MADSKVLTFAFVLSACAAPRVELVETAPTETTLDHADLRDAYMVWPEVIDRAQRSIDFGEFYASQGGRIEPVIAAIERAAKRGVRVRMLFDQLFYGKDPVTVDRLAAVPGVSVRRLDVKKKSGGILHAKYFIVDRRMAYVGSQNFDWRSLEHVQELGALVEDADVAAAIDDRFSADWAEAGGEPIPAAGHHKFGTVHPYFSPKSWLQPGEDWELTALVSLLDGAHRRVRVQLLTFAADAEELFAALNRAADRGVEVQLLVSDWCKRKRELEGLRKLSPKIAIELVTIPAHSSGFIPYARVVHAKYLVVDGRRAYVGTSNWEHGYFYDSRNLGLRLEVPQLAARLDRFFEDLWSSTYAEKFDRTREYEPPKTH